MGAGAWQGQEGILQQWSRVDTWSQVGHESLVRRSQVDTPRVLYASRIVPFVIPTTNSSLDSWNVGQVPLTDSSQDSWVWGGLHQQTVLNTVGVWGSLQTSPGQWSLQYFLGEMAPDTFPSALQFSAGTLGSISLFPIKAEYIIIISVCLHYAATLNVIVAQAISSCDA